MVRAERILTSATGRTVEVEGILADVAPKSLVVRDAHRDVTVLAASTIVPWLHRHARVLSPEQVAQIGAAAALASTWYQGDEVAGGPHGVRARFEALRSEVRKAWQRQLAWAVGISILGVGSFVVITYSILASALSAFGS